MFPAQLEDYAAEDNPAWVVATNRIVGRRSIP